MSIHDLDIGTWIEIYENLDRDEHLSLSGKEHLIKMKKK